MIEWISAAVLVCAAVWLWRGPMTRGRSRAWLDAWLVAPPGPAAQDAAAPPPVLRFPKRYRWAPWLAAIVTGAAIATLTPTKPPFAVAFAALASVAIWLLETHHAGTQTDLIESQLADAIDLMVGSLRAGAALLASLEAAMREAQEPFASELREMIGRIRLGDDPATAVRAFADRVPLESFRFFALSVAVHWETGGSLASTLLSVARTIRERTEMARRVRAQSVEANYSILAVMGITYGVAVMMWRSNPQSITAFMDSQAGSWIAAFCIGLQAIGIYWISNLSRVEH